MKRRILKMAFVTVLLAVAMIAAGLAGFRYKNPDKFNELAIRFSCPEMDTKMPFYPDYIFHPKEYKKGDLQLYTPFPYEPEEWQDIYRLDENGVVQVYREKEKTHFYNVVTIAQLAIASFKKYVDTKDPVYKKAFLDNNNYLKKNYTKVGEDEIAYPYEFAHGRLKPGWHSAMAQGQVISALALEYKLTGDPAILAHIRRVKKFMFRPVTQGGTFMTTPEGGSWFAEYAILPGDYVLNGAVFAVLGLYDYLSVIPDDEQVIKALPEIMSSLKASIPYYDTGRWLRYNRMDGAPVDYRYMEFQTLQMHQLYEVTGDPYYLDIYRKWKEYYRICIVDRHLN